MKSKQFSEEEICKRLVCKDIPNPRKLRELRVASVGKESSYEEHIRKYHLTEWNAPRLVRLPPDTLRYIYALALPLTFPLSDYCASNSCGSFQGECFQKGAMHLTTSEKMSELETVLEKHDIPKETKKPYSALCTRGEGPSTSICVPHSWYVDTYDPFATLFIHQFVAYDEPLFMVSYISREEWMEEDKEEDNFNYPTNSFSLRKEVTEHKTYQYFAIPLCEAHLKDAEAILLKKFAQWYARGSGKTELINIDAPVQIYDPSWV